MKKMKKGVSFYTCSYALATAACFAIIITGLYLFRGRGIRQPDTVSDKNANIIKGKSDSRYVESEAVNKDYSNIKFFVYEDTGSMEHQKSGTSDKEYSETGRKEILLGKTVKLKTAGYIVFGMDRDFYITIPQKAGKTYILNGKSGKKHFIKGEEVLCKAGNKVYFDISGIKLDKAGICGIEAWDKGGIEVTAFADIYLKNSKDLEKAARLYIGEKEKKKTVKNKKGDVYYGFIEIGNGN